MSRGQPKRPAASGGACCVLIGSAGPRFPLLATRTAAPSRSYPLIEGRSSTILPCPSRLLPLLTAPSVQRSLPVSRVYQHLFWVSAACQEGRASWRGGESPHGGFSQKPNERTPTSSSSGVLRGVGRGDRRGRRPITSPLPRRRQDTLKKAKPFASQEGRCPPYPCKGRRSAHQPEQGRKGRSHAAPSPPSKNSRQPTFSYL